MRTSLPSHDPTPQPLAGIAESPVDTDFHPAPLGWLMSWFMERRRPPPAAEPEAFEEHINGLA